MYLFNLTKKTYASLPWKGILEIDILKVCKLSNPVI